jgi:hypothetical protein
VRPRRNSRRLPKPDRRRALELLAASSDGCTEAIMLAHGFTVAQIVDLVCAGLATHQEVRHQCGSGDRHVVKGIAVMTANGSRKCR